MAAKIAHQTSPPPKEIRDVSTRGYINDIAGSAIESINISHRVTHDSSTYLVTGAVSFDPDLFVKPEMSMMISFRVMAAMGDTGPSGSVELRNLTDDEVVAVLPISGTTMAKYEAVLALGSGAGEIDSGSHLYQVSILVTPDTGPTDTVELYSAEIRVVNTLVL